MDENNILALSKLEISGNLLRTMRSEHSAAKNQRCRSPVKRSLLLELSYLFNKIRLTHASLCTLISTKRRGQRRRNVSRHSNTKSSSRKVEGDSEIKAEKKGLHTQTQAHNRKAVVAYCMPRGVAKLRPRLI